MTLLHALHRLLLACLLAILWPGSAFAMLSEVYDGVLLPDSFENPITITIEVREQGSTLIGRVKTGPPLNTSSPIYVGENNSGKCKIRTPITPTITLRLFGSCHQTLYEGTYTMLTVSQEARSHGIFRMQPRQPKKKETEEEKNRSIKALPPADTLTDCIRSNTRCLLGCPRGDYNVEFLCSNRCRQKFQSCKSKSNQPPATAPTPEAASAEAR